MKLQLVVLLAFCVSGVPNSSRPAANRHYPVNRPPLEQSAFVELPLGAVKPAGWLKDQLNVQANGLTGHLDEFWGSLMKSAWDGGDGESWERGPYYLDGLVPLAYLLEDKRLQKKAQRYIDWIVTSGQENGWFGPAKNKDRWPLAVAMKVLTQYQEATGDERVIPLFEKYFEYLKNEPPDWPDKAWRGVRAMENLVTAYWLYRRTGNRDVLRVAKSIHDNSFDWISYFRDFPYTVEKTEAGLKYGHPTHVVNIAMATKHPAVWFQQSRDAKDREAIYRGLASLDKHHGQVAGRFAGDEHLSGLRPTQGTELCGVVEYMFSMENAVAVLGDAAFADRLELLAYNANPGTCTPDYWAHQYDQQANQVLCTIARRRWSTNSNNSNIYGLEPNYGCCTSNMHQGWPKFVSHMWMATHDNGLVAVAYGPNVVKAKVGDGIVVTVEQTTDYPFDGRIRFQVNPERASSFPLYFRVPGWAGNATLTIGGNTLYPSAGTFFGVERKWRPGDEAVLELPMRVRAETRYNNAVAILRGPIYYSLRIGEKYEKLKSYSDKFPVVDWAIHPTTPWNYGLLIDRNDPEKSVEVERRNIGEVPFANEAAPVVLKLKGRAIPEWNMERNSAGETPVSPVKSVEPTVDLELIPYGSTRLRITEFPVIETE